MPSTSFPEWLNSNSLRAYPLAEDSSRIDTTGNIKIPDALIVDAIINITPGLAAGTVFVSSVSLFPDTVEVEISFFDPSPVSTSIISKVTVNVASHTLNKSYAFSGQGDFSSVVGMIAIGDLNTVISEVSGKYSFTEVSAPFEIHSIYLSSPMVRSISVYSGNEIIQTFTDVLKLKAGDNIRLTYEGADTIRIDAIGTGDGFVQQSEQDACSGIGTQKIPAPIRTINGKAGDSNGNFNIEGGDCISINTDTAKISLQDVCSQSCCGCSELETLVSGLRQVEQDIATLESSINTVQGIQSQLVSNLSTANS